MLAAVLALLLPAGSAGAQTVDIEAVADEVDATGRYLERDVDAAALEAIDRANADGVAFVRLDTPQDGASAAQELAVELASRDSRYGAVIVLTNNSVYARGVSETLSAVPPDVTNLFGNGQIAEGIDAVVDNLDGAARGGDPRNTGSDGGGFPWILVVVLAIGAFLLVNMVRGRRKTRKLEAKTIEDDRAEIKEQLRANADRVIELGDEVIATKDAELIAVYEEASRAYQNVSTEIDNAKTAAEVDALDDQIDKAEWQFEVIEAKLSGKPAPPFVDDDEPDEPPPPAPPPVASPAERDAQLRRRTQPPRPLPRRNPRTRMDPPASSTGSLLGGTFGRLAMSVIVSLLMGGRLGRPRMSRRSSRRGGYGGFGRVL